MIHPRSPISIKLSAAAAAAIEKSWPNLPSLYSTLAPFGFQPSVHSPPTCNRVFTIFYHPRKHHEIDRRKFIASYINDPKNVLPVRTTKQIALNATLCWCNIGSKIRCSITPARIWYLLNRECDCC